MGRAILSAGHGGYELGEIDPGVQAGGTSEASEMMLLRDLTAQALKARGIVFLSVPDTLSLTGTVAWINVRGTNSDIALEIHLDAASSPYIRGTTAYYIANNTTRQRQAETLLRSLLLRVPQLANLGAKPDTSTGMGERVFCRQVAIPSLVLTVGYLTNTTDRTLIQTRRGDIATGIAEGLAQILGYGGTNPNPTTYEAIGIRVNNQTYPERGILVNGNAYIPINLADRLGIDLANDPNVTRIRYQNIVYIKAIDLRPYNVSVGWDNATRSVLLRTVLDICTGLIGRIMGHGSTSETQLALFLKAYNPNGITAFPDLPALYREEARTEGVNYDIAFSQMCVETNFLQFGGVTQPTQNNFGGLGSLEGNPEGASFPSARIGVRAHIQHLKAYGSTEPLVNAVVDPRFSFVPRGVAPTIEGLTGRWSADPSYDTKIRSRLQQLYERAGLL